MDDELVVDFDEDDGSPGRDDGGPPRRRPTGVLLAAVAAVCALAVVLLVFGPPGDWQQTSAPKPSPTPPVVAAPTETGAATDGFTITDANGIQADLPGTRGALSVAPLCAPGTDGGRTIVVSFQVVNVSTARVRLTDAAPRLRSGLLRLRSVRLGGSCGDPGDEKLDRYLAPSERVLVTMTLAILDDCPDPAPVGVRITYRTDGSLTSEPVTRTLSYALFADLGSVVFAGC